MICVSRGAGPAGGAGTSVAVPGISKDASAAVSIISDADNPGLVSSTMNLILYLPSSMTSLLRRTFFLTGWPFR